MAITQKPRINPSEYNQSATDRIPDALRAEVGYAGLKEDFLRDELNLARKLDMTTPVPSSENDILTFTITGQEGTSTINATAHTVAVVMPAETDLSELTATFTLSEGATSEPSSPFTDDFTSPVSINVIAEDETEQVWTVTVTEAA